MNKLPVPEPSIFTGDPLEYPAWVASFHTLISSKNINPGEKIHYLRRYLHGEAKDCVEGMFLFNTETTYKRALDLLSKRFGSEFAISEAFREKLYGWPQIRESDSKGMRQFSDVLQQCDLAKCSIKGLECLSDCRENKKMLAKLPDYVIVKWNRMISDYDGYFPPFSTFAAFIAMEADVECNPITSLNAVRSLQSKCSDVESNDAISLVSVQSSAFSIHNCRYCHGENHRLHRCNSFIALMPDGRKDFMLKKRLCFGCLEFGHQSNNCKLKKICKTCKKRHPTCLHGDYEATSHREQEEQSDDHFVDDRESNNSRGPTEKHNLHVMQDRTHCGMIVPVYVSNVNSPSTEILTYALLDTQSDATFVLSKIGDAVQTNKSPSTMKLSTLTPTKIMNRYEYSDLQVGGFNQDVRIPLPNTFSCEEIPDQVAHIQTQSVAKQWPHLQHLSNQIPERLNCEIGLLIGYNCPQALAPREFVSCDGNIPFAQKTLLGWSIVGITDERNICKDARETSSSMCEGYLMAERRVPHTPNSLNKKLQGTSTTCNCKINLMGQVYRGECKCR